MADLVNVEYARDLHGLAHEQAPGCSPDRPCLRLRASALGYILFNAYAGNARRAAYCSVTQMSADAVCVDLK